MNVDPHLIDAARREARATAAHVRLCLQHRSWQGALGNWAGAGTGTSIDFQDHRPYLPGDDPRHIDWAAYARSGQTIMKLHREEVSPRLDLLVDVSHSMLGDPAKRDLVLRLLFFCVESACALGAALRILAFSGPAYADVSLESILCPAWSPPELPGANAGPRIEALPLRPGSLRLLLSDLLYPDPPASILRPLGAPKCRAIVMAPFHPGEENPGWRGNLEFQDRETGAIRRQRVDARVLAAYRTAYERHHLAWRETARRHDIRLARVTAGLPLADALCQEAYRLGVIEPWG